jgi:hypothetical protein
MRRITLISAAALSVCGLVALGAAPASAAELPADNALFALSSETFYSSATDGALTPISGLPDNSGKYGADYDPTTGKAFYFEDGNPCTLYSLDITTGVSTEIGLVDDPGTDECDALDVAQDGTLRIGDQDGVVLTVDKTTGAVLSSVPTNIDPLSFITQAADGTFYAGTYDGALFTYDPATGVGTPIPSPLSYIETASIDSAGTLWITSDGDDVCEYGLWSLDIADPVGTLEFQGDLADDEGCVSAFALFVSGPPPAPQLAATGGSPAMVLAPFAVLGMIAGLGALVFARRQRSA